MWCFVDPPHIKDSGQAAELSLTPGAPLELYCDAQGTPSPNITWQKDGQALSGQEDGTGAGRLLRVQAVQVLLSCLWDESGGGESKGTRQHVARFGRAPPLCGVRMWR